MSNCTRSPKKSSSGEKILTYTYYDNLFLGRVALEEDRTCEFSIGVYTYQQGKCLLDIREVYGEHFTFNEFLEIFKKRLREQDIIDTPVFSQAFLNSYGLDIEIGLDAFDQPIDFGLDAYDQAFDQESDLIKPLVKKVM